MIFTVGKNVRIKDILEIFVKGVPKDIITPARFSGMDLKQTSLFQSLIIAKKFVKAQIEIDNPVTVISERDKKAKRD